MITLKTFKAAAFALALAGLGLTTPNADAGSPDTTVCRTSDQYQREYNRGQHYDQDRHYARTQNQHSNDGFSFSIRVGSSDRHYNRHYNGDSDRYYTSRQVVYRNDRHRDGYYDAHRSRTYTRSAHDTYPTRRVVVVNHNAPSGYWKRVYVPAIYETRYYACGTPYRVCVRSSSYKRVWVSTSYRY